MLGKPRKKQESMKQTVSIPYMLAGILFIVCLIVSNLLEVKIIQIGPITATAGLIVFPIAYILNDCIVEVWGYRKAKIIIWCGFAMNFFTVGLLQLAIYLPAAPFWEGQESFQSTFSIGPRIVAASLCAFLIGSFINAYIMSWMKVKSNGKYFPARAILSTVAGEIADSSFFFPIAFGGIIANDHLLIMIITQACLKSLYEVIILPLTIRIVHWLKKIEQIDTYDHSISFNPFKLKE